MSELGSDLSCITDLTPSMAEVTGRRALAEAVARRWSTPRGRLIDDPNYGFDLTQFVNDDVDPPKLARIKAGAEAEAGKDERVEDAEVSLVFTAGGLLIVTGTLTDAAGPFTLTCAVSAVTVQLLQVDA